MLQPMDVAVNKPAKDFLKRCFEQWYYEQIANQLAESDDLEDIEIQPVDLRLQTLKEWGAKWLVDMVDFIQDNPQFIVNGFIKAGILGAIDGVPKDEIQSVEEHA